MLKDHKILLGKAKEKEIYMLLHQMNRHGLIAGASGTGKTVTLKVIAESLSDAGVPTFIADVKGDLTGMITPGNLSCIQERLDSMSISGFETKSYPVRFFDVYKKNGLPMRAVMQEMDPVLLSRILDLSDAQEGVLNIIFKIAEDKDLDIIDLKDLQAMCAYVGENASSFTVKYGMVTKQSIGAIQRKLLVLEQQEGDKLFGMPGLNIQDLLQTENGNGVMNILECEKLFQHPLLYATFLLWLLDTLYQNLPEVGDLEQPEIVFFFDEAHLLFDHAPKALLDKVEQTVKLIRSKGVGVFFCTQSPSDIPDSVLAQLSNRIQHALRAYTPSEMKNVRLAAQAFRQNPELNTEEVITMMKTGHALVSVLDEDGAPTIVEETKILPPSSSMKASEVTAIFRTVNNDPLKSKYWDEIGPESAFEKVDEIKKEAEEEKNRLEEEKKIAKIEEARAKQAARLEAREEKQRANQSKRIAKKIQNKAENELINLGVRSAKKFLKSFMK